MLLADRDLGRVVRDADAQAGGQLQTIGQRRAEVILARDADGLAQITPGLRGFLAGDERRGEQLRDQRVEVVVGVDERFDDALELGVFFRATAGIGVVAELLRPGAGVQRMLDQRLGEIVERLELGLFAQVVERSGGEDLRRIVLRVVRVGERLAEDVPHRVHRLVAAVTGAGRIRVLAVLAVVEHGGGALVDRVDAATEADDQRLVERVAVLVAVVRRPVGEERRRGEVTHARGAHDDLVRRCAAWADRRTVSASRRLSPRAR